MDGPAAAIKSIEFVTRRPDLPVDVFQRHWREVHGPIAAAIPVLRRYVQSHALPETYARRPPPFDGIAMTWFDSTDAMRQSATTPEYARTRADEANFIAPGGHRRHPHHRARHRRLKTPSINRHLTRAKESPMPEPSLPTADRANGYFKDLNNWGRWGNDDQLGTLNLITPAKLLQGQRLISTGRAVSLARDVIPRPVYMYHVTYPAKRERVDVVLDRFDMVYHGFWITHVDALCHVGWDGELYNGRPFVSSLSVEGASWCPIDPISARGITTRGVFLDIAAARPEGFVTVGKPVTPRELDECERRAGVRVEPGDVVVVRSGDEAFRRANPDWVPRVSPHPGLHLSCLEWFRSKDIAAIAWDMMDERPSGYPGFGMTVHLAIPFLGLALVDNVDPERLAQACAEHGRTSSSSPRPRSASSARPARPRTRSRSSRSSAARRRHRVVGRSCTVICPSDVRQRSVSSVSGSPS